MRTFVLIAFVTLVAMVSTVPAQQQQRPQQTWLGQISDSLCALSHEEAAYAGGGRQEKLSDRECTLACVRGGSKYVFVTDGMVYQISDQKDPALQTLAGETVKLTGEMNGDVITAATIEKP